MQASPLPLFHFSFIEFASGFVYFEFKPEACIVSIVKDCSAEYAPPIPLPFTACTAQ
jgi:hypothetical protein